jgi:hypothetical protein
MLDQANLQEVELGSVSNPRNSWRWRACHRPVSRTLAECVGLLRSWELPPILGRLGPIAGCHFPSNGSRWDGVQA